MRLLVDCDPGHDDAVALIAAAHHGELVAVTTVSGNVGLEHTTRNALATLQVLGSDVPVHAGAAGPLAGTPTDGSLVHGESGLAGATLPSLIRSVASHDAVGAILAAAEANADLWIVATGPLTNVAHALERDPALAHRVAGISIMGGGTFGNVTPAAEFNIWFDPEAADIVFRSGARLVMCGLDLTHQLLVDDALVARCRGLGNHTGSFCADFLGEYLATIRRLTRADSDAALHDPCALLAVTHPGIFRFEQRPVAVELRGEHTRGMTLVDRRSWVLGGNVEVACTIDAGVASALLVEAIAAGE